MARYNQDGDTPDVGNGDGSDWWANNAPPPDTTTTTVDRTPPPADTRHGPPSYADARSMLDALLASGTDPQSAVNQVNKQFNLPEGQSLKYYPPGAHGVGSGAVVGLPASVGGGYLAPDSSGKWGWNVGDSQGFGSTPPPFQTPPLPTSLQTPYVAPTWTGGPFTAPTQSEVEATPGYKERFDMGLQAGQRSAAAQGSVLSGGTQKAIARYGQDYGTNAYQSTFANNLAAYQEKYGQFKDAASMGLGERNQNLGEYQTSLGNQYNQYLTNYNIKHTAEDDLWKRLADLYGTGSKTADNSKPAGA